MLHLANVFKYVWPLHSSVGLSLFHLYYLLVSILILLADFGPNPGKFDINFAKFFCFWIFISLQFYKGHLNPGIPISTMLLLIFLHVVLAFSFVFALLCAAIIKSSIICFPPLRFHLIALILLLSHPLPFNVTSTEICSLKHLPL